MEPPDTITLSMVRESYYVAVVCDVLDQLGYRCQAPRGAWPVRTSDDLLVGRCKTTLWADMAHEDPRPYELELQAIDSCQADDIFVAAGGASLRSGLWGELLTQAALNRGCVGAVLDGAVRDVKQICSRQFPVWARGTSPYDSLHRHRVIDVDIPVEVGGVLIHPGDLLLADVDGVVVVPQDVEREVLARAWSKIHTENQIRSALQNGLSAREAFARFGTF